MTNYFHQSNEFKLNGMQRNERATERSDFLCFCQQSMFIFTIKKGSAKFGSFTRKVFFVWKIFFYESVNFETITDHPVYSFKYLHLQIGLLLSVGKFVFFFENKFAKLMSPAVIRC